MTISRNVILDLLPLYVAGEASEESRALLEQYLRENPEFAAAVRDRAEKTTALLASVVQAPPPPDHEKATLERVRRFNRRRTFLLAFCIFLTLTPFAFGFEGRRVHWMMHEGGNWAGWFNVSGGVGQAGGQVAAISRFADHIDLFTVGADGAAYSTWWDINGGWAGWFPLGITWHVMSVATLPCLEMVSGWSVLSARDERHLARANRIGRGRHRRFSWSRSARRAGR